MRKFSYILMAVFMLSVGELVANETKPKPTKSLSHQIKNLIGHESIHVKDKDLRGKILFTVNQYQEIVVLAVQADTKEMEDFIKSRLSFKKVTISNWEDGKRYVLPVVVTS